MLPFPALLVDAVNFSPEFQCACICLSKSIENFFIFL